MSRINDDKWGQAGIQEFGDLFPSLFQFMPICLFKNSRQALTDKVAVVKVDTITKKKGR